MRGSRVSYIPDPAKTGCTRRHTTSPPRMTGGRRRDCAPVASNSAWCLSNTKRSSDMKVIVPLAVSAGGPSRGAAVVFWNAASCENMAHAAVLTVRSCRPGFGFSYSCEAEIACVSFLSLRYVGTSMSKPANADLSCTAHT